jgi:exopolysaccharide biosynthesis polyprenyl glycosylphosphotransferase
MLKIFNRHIASWTLVLFAGDFTCYSLSVVTAIFVNPITAKYPWEFFVESIIPFILVGITYFLVLFIADVYDFEHDFRQPINLARVFLSSWVGTMVIMIVYYFPFGSFVGRTLLLIQASSFSFLMVTWRFSFSTIALPERLQKRMIIVGTGRSAQFLLKTIMERPRCGILPVGFIEDRPEKVGERVCGLPVLGDSSRLEELIAAHRISLVAVAGMNKKSPSLINTLIKASWRGCQLLDMPMIVEYLTGTLPTGHISENWLFEWNLKSSKVYFWRIKRIIDLSLSIFFLIITSALFVIVALLVKLDSRGPVFFRQERLGQDGKPFEILKFRTMKTDAASGPTWTRDNDSRITRLGKFIRKLRLDELPQLLNILRGEMSFIGPRPLVPPETNDGMPYFNYRLLAKPGLTGWAQVMYPEGLSLDTTPEKVKYDLYYIKNMGLLLDLAILLKTIRIVLFGRGR